MVAPAPPLSSFPRSTGKLSARIRETWPLNVTRLSGKASGIGGPPGHAGDRCGRPSAPADPLEHFGTLAGEGNPACVSGLNTRNVSTALNPQSPAHTQTGPGRRWHSDRPETRLRSQQEHPAHTGHPHMRPSPGHTHPTVQRVRRTGNADLRVDTHATRELGRHKDGPTVDNNRVTPEERSRINRRNRLRGYEGMTPADIERHMAPAREGFHNSFEAKADPEGRMTPEDRAAAAERLRSAHFSELARKSAAVRQQKARRRKAIRDAALRAAEEAIRALDAEDDQAAHTR